MSAPQSGGPPAPEAVGARLHEIARLLREADHLGPESQKVLADLADQLGNSLGSANLASGEETPLADSAAHLIETLRQRHDAGRLAAARDRLEQAVLDVEARAPVAAGVARALLDALANLGI
jgi:hypothetical protein